MDGFIEAINRKSKVIISWNIHSTYRSSVTIDFSHITHEKKGDIRSEVFIVEDGVYHGKPFYIPPGEIRVNLTKLTQLGARINGDILVLSEPIIGLKPHGEEWTSDTPTYISAKLRVETMEDAPSIHVDFTNTHYLEQLNNTILGELHMGLNDISIREEQGVISPILTRTSRYIHFWIIDKKNNSYYQFIAKNAEIKTQNGIIWRTTKELTKNNTTN